MTSPDESLCGRIAMGAGTDGLSLLVDLAELIGAYDVVEDITKSPAPM